MGDAHTSTRSVVETNGGKDTSSSISFLGCLEDALQLRSVFGLSLFGLLFVFCGGAAAD